MVDWLVGWLVGWLIYLDDFLVVAVEEVCDGLGHPTSTVHYAELSYTPHIYLS